jgi:hypothetical protein
MSESVASETSRGVLSTNRPPAFSHREIIGSEDTAVLSLYVHWEENIFKAITEYFDELKEAAQNGNHDKDFLELGGKTYLFSPTGHKSGTGTGPMYRWKMECEGVKISIGNHHIPKKEIPNVIVHVGSLFLMKNGGLLGSWSDIKEMIETFYGKIEIVKISRVDGCVDLVDIDVTEYVSRFESNCYISKSRKGGVFNDGKRKTGFKLGTGKQIRIYDKRLEVEHQPEKQIILVETRWGGRLPQYATRVEFQIGAEDLRDLGIQTLEDYKKKRHSLYEYFTHDWFRMTDQSPKDNHHSRLETASVWKRVQNAFNEWTGSKIDNLKFRKDTFPDNEQLGKQAIGCVSSSIALKDIEFDDLETFKYHLIGEFTRFVKSIDVKHALAKTDHKRRRFNSLGRVFK